MRPRTPEGPRFLRSDGTPDKTTRIHKETKWLDYVHPPEALHSPNTTFRAALLEFLTTHRINVIVADGDKYVGVVTLPRLAATIALWRERETPIYKILLENIKKVEEKTKPILDGMGDKEVSEVLVSGSPSIDEAPVVKEEKVVGVLRVREALLRGGVEAPIGSIAEPLPSVGSLGEALIEMENKDLPVVLVGDRILDARDVAKRIWEERTEEVGRTRFEDLLTEPYEVFKYNVSIREVLESIDPLKVDYVLVERGGGYGVVPLPRLAAKVLHP